MHLGDFIAPEAVIPSLKAKSKKQLLQELSSRDARLTGLEERYIFDVLLQRERLGSTGLGQGIAIPHGRIRGLAEAQGAFVRLKSPIPFDAPDGKPVAQVFVLLVPEHATEQHLQLLSELAQMFSEARFRDSLGTAGDAAGLREVFDRWEPAA